MRVLFFSPYYIPYISGITTYPSQLFHYLKKEHVITTLTFPHKNKMLKREIIDGITVIRMPYLFKISKGYISISSLWAFFINVLQNKLVIINIPNFEGLPLVILAKLFRKKIIAIHHCDVHLSRSFFESIISFFLQLSIHIQLSLADTVVVYTKDYAQYAGLYKKYPNRIVETLPPMPKDPVDKQYLSFLKNEKKQNEWVGFAGRIAEIKGLEYLIKAAHKLNKQVPNLVLVFAGPYGKDVAGENNYYVKIKQLLSKYKIDHIFLGNLNKAQLYAFYQSIETLVLPSTNKTESFGMVQAEAMMVGTPVISTNLPGVRVPIQMTNMGIIVKQGKVKDLATAIKEVMYNRNKYTNSTLQNRATELFNFKNTVKIYSSIISSMN